MKNSKGNRKPASLTIYVIAFAISHLATCFVHAAPKPNPSSTQFITKFPFKLSAGGIIVFKATVGTFPDTLNFILDTGCEGISLDSATALAFRLMPTYTNKTIRGMAVSKQAAFVLNQSLNLPGLKIDGLDFHINDYGFLTANYGFPIHGVIGYTFLSRFIMYVNYDNLMIEVWRPGEIKYPKKGALLPITVNKLPVFEAQVNDHRQVTKTFIFDTGADLCFLLPHQFVNDSNLISDSKKRIPVQAQGLGGNCEMDFTVVDELKLGPYNFKKVPSYIFKDKFNIARYPANGGVIGNALLHHFNLIINYSAGEIHLSPNSFFKDPFEYTYTGFTINENKGRVTVGEVVKGSPAEKAGLMVGDVVMGINNDFSNDLNRYTDIICSSRKHVKMSILRRNQFKTVIVSVGSNL
jgi:hypothetical protein